MSCPAGSSNHAVLLVLWHPPVHAGNSDLGLMHLVSEPVNLVRGIAENDCLTDGCSLIEINKRVKLRLFLNINEKLFDAVQRKFIILQHPAPRPRDLGIKPLLIILYMLRSSRISSGSAIILLFCIVLPRHWIHTWLTDILPCIVGYY